MQPPPTNQNRNPVLFSNTTSDACHHPGYQRLIEQSWWCDHCLSDCHRLQEMQIEDESRWYDFFIWLRDLMVKAAAVSVSAVFCIFAYAMGKMDRSQQSINDLQQELAGLYREQQYLLDDIVDIDRDRSQSHYDTEYPGNHLLDVELAKRMRRLDKVVDEINVLTRYIDKRRAASEFENLVTVQTSLSGPCHIP